MARRTAVASTLALALALGLVSGPALGSPAAAEVTGHETALRVTYLGNSGFLVAADGHRVLVDALFGDGVPGYETVPEPLRSELERGAGEWGGVTLALATHFHPDHFDAAAVARFLAANPQASFVSTPQAVDRLRALHPAATLLDRCRAVLPAPGTSERLEVGGVQVDVLNLHHGHREPPVENLGLVVHSGDLGWLHFGDTEAKMEDFAPYLDLLAEPDLALLPFWFLSSEWRADLVRDRLRPRWIVVAHTPLPTAPAGHFARWLSYDNLLTVMRQAFPDAVLPTAPGESYELPVDPARQKKIQ
jgi:L-ascorbate metabolism protein UlaG (beta-lactamase superfamily)